MARVLVAYGTSEGQTERIAEVIGDVLRDAGHEAAVLDVNDLGGVVPEGYDAVVLGASIHMGKHDKHVVALARDNLGTLERLPSAFFSVSLAAQGDQAEAEGYVRQFEEETGWHPDQRALFGGALLYTHYGFLKRRMMRRIVAGKPGDLGVDTSRDYVYTEWDAVRAFAEHVAAGLEPGAG
ncbi:flavodoxin domain-containing protein [Nocardioides sediminis]|uniref:flavodoxin domain-containing protein n=1 Tax=Nocardioides sediminis TaxID=433648 RepID=UPI000D2F4A6E|nr:flavodoxin domain-containing protein [Nocardioides sediminis]